MTNPRLIALVFAVCLVSNLGAPVSAGARDADGGDLVVSLRDGASVDEVNAKYGTRTVGTIRGANVFKLRSGDATDTLKRLRRDNSVRGVTRDTKVHRHQTYTFPFDEPETESAEGAGRFAEQFADHGRLGELGVEAAKSLTDGGEPVLVAVLDTGVDPTHPAVASQLWSNPAEANGTPGVDDDGDGYVDDVSGYDFVDDDASPDERGTSGPIAGHGTFISGLVVAAAPRARILPIRVMNGDGVGSAFDAAAGIAYAVRKGAKVLNLSFGTDVGVVPPILEAAVRSASRQGVTIVVAAGNDATADLPYPASDTRNAVAVGASDGDHAAEFSNFGSPQRRVAVWAPGTELVGPMPGEGPDGGPRYARWSGTSFAAALATAAFAELLSVRGTGSPSLLRSFILTSGAALASARGTTIRLADAVLASMYDARRFDLQIRVRFDDAPGWWGSEGGMLRSVMVASRLVETVSVSAYELRPRARYTLHARAGASDSWIEVGSASADAMGSVYLKAWKAERPGSRPPLGVPVRSVRALELRDEAGVAVRHATVNPDTAPMQGEALFERADGGPLYPSFARFWHDERRLTLTVELRGLAAETAYEIVVDGVSLGLHTAVWTPAGYTLVRYFTADDSGAGDSELQSWDAHGAPSRVEIYRVGGRRRGTLEFAASFDELPALVIGGSNQHGEQ